MSSEEEDYQRPSIQKPNSQKANLDESEEEDNEPRRVGDQYNRLPSDRPGRPNASEDDLKPKEAADLKGEDIALSHLRQEIQLRKDRNEANQQLQNFKKCLQKQGTSSTSTVDKIALIPSSLKEDLKEAVLYAYFAVRYFDDHIYKVIQSRTMHFQEDPDLAKLLGRDGSFMKLTGDESKYSRYRLNQTAFEAAIDKDYVDVAFHFIETGEATITWELVRKMIARRQEYLVKQCIKYGSKFDAGMASAGLKKMVFAGRAAASLEDRTIKLVDFVQVMLELEWPTKDITDILTNYSKKGKIDNFDMRELFLMFAVKRKIKLMSMLINGDQFQMDFTEENFVDVLENEAFDMAVLLYREYFLRIKDPKIFERIVTLLVNSFSKSSSGQLEAKCLLMKKFMNKMNFE